MAVLTTVLLTALPVEAQFQSAPFRGYFPNGYPQPGMVPPLPGCIPRPYAPQTYGQYAPQAYRGYVALGFGAYGPSWGYPYQPYSFYNAFGPTNSPNAFYEPWGYPSFVVNPAYYAAQPYGSLPAYNTQQYYSAAAHRGTGASYAADSSSNSRQSFYPPADRNR